MIYRWASAPPAVWIVLHLLVYAVLDVATVVVLDGPGPAAADIGWGLPLHLGALVLAAIALMFLRTVENHFRLIAVAVFVLPATAITLLFSRDVTTLAVVLPWHLLMGLLVLKPRPW